MRTWTSGRRRRSGAELPSAPHARGRRRRRRIRRRRGASRGAQCTSRWTWTARGSSPSSRRPPSSRRALRPLRTRGSSRRPRRQARLLRPLPRSRARGRSLQSWRRRRHSSTAPHQALQRPRPSRVRARRGRNRLQCRHPFPPRDPFLERRRLLREPNLQWSLLRAAAQVVWHLQLLVPEH